MPFTLSDRRSRPWAAALGVALLALPGSASGSLGGDASSVELDATRMKAIQHVVYPGPHTVHEIRLPGGTVLREYLTTEGVVFGVAWSGPFRPDLQQVLGAYFDEFRDAARAAKSRHAGRAPLIVDRPDLVVHMGGRMRAFVGRAFVPGLVPADTSVDGIR